MKKGGTIFVMAIATVLLIGGAGFGYRAYKQANCEHEFGEGEIVKAATCDGEGLIEYECENCGKIKEEEIAATGHTVVQLDAIRATCTSTGLHAGEMCSVCEKILTKQEVIPMLNHDLEMVAGEISTCTVMGYMDYEACKDCDYTTEIVYLPLLDHAYETVAAQAATCTEIGWEEYQVCTLCGYKDGYVELPLADHDYYNDFGQYVCAVCGDIESYVISYEVDGEIVYTQTQYYTATCYISCETPVKDGYTFKGWFLKDTDTEFVSEYLFMHRNDITVEARFEAEGADRQVTPTTGESIAGNTYRIYAAGQTALNITVVHEGELTELPFSFNGTNLVADGTVIDCFETNVVEGEDGYIDVTFNAGDYTVAEVTFTIDETCTVKSVTGEVYRLNSVEE